MALAQGSSRQSELAAARACYERAGTHGIDCGGSGGAAVAEASAKAALKLVLFCDSLLLVRFPICLQPASSLVKLLRSGKVGVVHDQCLPALPAIKPAFWMAKTAVALCYKGLIVSHLPATDCSIENFPDLLCMLNGKPCQSRRGQVNHSGLGCLRPTKLQHCLCGACCRPSAKEARQVSLLIAYLLRPCYQRARLHDNTQGRSKWPSTLRQ